MNANERKGKRSARSIRTLSIFVIFCLCCIALVPAVAAIYPNDKWLTPNWTVKANTSNYAIINGVQWQNKHFFAVVGNGHYNSSNPAYNWTRDSTYTDRYYMEQMKVGSTWYPNTSWNRGGAWQWEFVSDLTPTATIYKKGLGGYVNSASGTYYAWWGNKTAAYITYNGHTNWLVPSYENATFMVNLTETWG